MLRRLSSLLVAAVLSQPVCAEVIYTWKESHASPDMPPGLRLELVFSDSAVARGSLALEVHNRCYETEPCIDPQDSLLSLRYWYDGVWPDGSAAQWNLIHYDYRSHPRYYSDYLFLDIRFLPGGLLGGTIRANDSNSDFLMESQDSLFTVMSARSDEYFGCGGVSPDCHGARGMLVDTRAPLPIPEPPLTALGVIGILGAWLARRRGSR